MKYLTIPMLLFNLSLFGQCTILSENGVSYSGSATRSIGGQTFIACDSGELEEIILKFSFVGPGSKFELRFYEGSGFNNLIWTTDTLTITSNSALIYDISQGTGTNSVVDGTEYSFNIYSVGSDLLYPLFDYYAIDHYPDGTRLKSDGTPPTTGPDQDMYFSLAINGAVLPVELLEFSSRIDDLATSLNWKTASELNNYGFEIERSSDAQNWTAIGFVPGSGTTSEVKDYTFTDYHPSLGVNYYRLKQIDHDGHSEYSEVLSEEFIHQETWSIYPVPVKDRITVNAPSDAIITLYNLQGELIDRQFNHKGMIDISGSSDGVYYLHISHNNRTEMKKIVKQ